MGKRKCFYLRDEQCEWISEMAEINYRSESYFVQLAVDMLMEVIDHE